MAEAIKFDGGKPRVDLLDRTALEKLATVLAFGAQKYDAHNWRKGMDWSRMVGAALRHIHAFNDGALCCLMFLSNYQVTRTEFDDRYIDLDKAGEVVYNDSNPGVYKYLLEKFYHADAS
jgi:hypothetical protein